MGEIMARLHGLHLSWSPRFDSQAVAEEMTWAELAKAGARRGAQWSPLLSENIAALRQSQRPLTAGGANSVPKPSWVAIAI